jgi:hypothetical protein
VAKYNPAEIEVKWQNYWAEHKTFKTSLDKSKPKYYCLDMFPYPIGCRATCWPPRRLHSNRHYLPLQTRQRV